MPDNVMVDVEQVTKRVTKNLEKQQVPQRASTTKAVPLFKHLHQYEKDNSLTHTILLVCDAMEHHLMCSASKIGTLFRLLLSYIIICL